MRGQQHPRIARVGSLICTKTYDGRLRNPIRQWSRKDVVLVVIEDEEGVQGLGECWVGGGRGEVLAAFLATEIGPLLSNEPAAPRPVSDLLLHRSGPSGRPDLWYAAASGVDVALWDVAARRTGQPLYRLLGASSRSAPVYASGGMYGISPEDLAEEAAKAFILHGGYKFKAGGATIEDDDARLRAMRRAAPDGRLMADFMFRPPFPEALRRLQRLVDFDLHFVEAPTAIEHPEAWAQLHRLTGLNLSGPEIGTDIAMHRRYLECSATQVLQFDLGLCGGITGGLRLAALAQAFGQPFALHCAGSAVVFAASAHLAAACGTADSVERHLLHTMHFDLLEAAGVSFEAGRVHLPSTPGLGFDCDLAEFGDVQWH